MTVLILIETVLLAVLTVLVAGLLRAYGTVLRRLHALDGGAAPSASASREFDLLPMAQPAAAPARANEEFAAAHDISGESLAGEIVSARVVDVEHDTLLLFLSSGCASCETFWTELGRPVSLPLGTRLLVVPQSATEESVSDLAAMAPNGVDVVLSTAAWTDYEVPGSPHVVFVDGRSGRIRGEGTGQSLRQVSELLARSTGDAGFVGGAAPAQPKSSRDALSESAIDRELLAAGILPGDPRLWGDGARGDEESA